MEIGRIQPWQVPLLAMALVALVEWAVGAALRKWPLRVDWRLMRSLAFAAAILLAAALLIINYLSEADKVANIVSAVAAVVTLWLTYRSFQPRTPEPPAQRPAPDRESQRVGQ